MRRRLPLAALCMLVLPVLFSSSSPNQLMTSTPFATVAFAGHTVAGDWCPCGIVDCICDPGEQSARPVSDAAPIRHSGKAKAVHAENIDLVTGAFLIALAFFVLSRFRA